VSLHFSPFQQSVSSQRVASVKATVFSALLNAVQAAALKLVAK
jgi:hypothetical protein